MEGKQEKKRRMKENKGKQKNMWRIEGEVRRGRLRRKKIAHTWVSKANFLFTSKLPINFINRIF